MPEIVISQSGACEQDCIFITQPEMPSEPENSIWVVTKYDLANWALEMYKVAPEHTISTLQISLVCDSDDSTTAHISYEITAIGAAGDKFLEEFTEDWYKDFMVEWEKAMNHYLDTGNKLVYQAVCTRRCTAADNTQQESLPQPGSHHEIDRLHHLPGYRAYVSHGL